MVNNTQIGLGSMVHGVCLGLPPLCAFLIKMFAYKFCCSYCGLQVVNKTIKAKVYIRRYLNDWDIPFKVNVCLASYYTKTKYI